jgi:hypothetical protein
MSAHESHRMTEGRTTTAMMQRFLKVLLPATFVLGVTAQASAQEVQVTGPLAGAPAVRNLREHRKGRFEIAPQISFTLLDEYQRTILVGARINYNITDWLALGVWGAFGAVKEPTGLSEKIQSTNDDRFSTSSSQYTGLTKGSNPYNSSANVAERRLTLLNLGQNFTSQLGKINWVIAPQITAVPFRGKLALFQKIFVDTDAYFFAGPAFVNITERADCGNGTSINCSAASAADASPTGNAAGALLPDEATAKQTASRIAIAPTFGLGLSFYTGKWMGFGLEWRGLPFSWNTGGFDTRGGGPNNKFPDNKVDSSDRQFKFNQMISLSFSIYLPTEMKISE